MSKFLPIDFCLQDSNKLWLFGVSPYSHILLRYSLHLVAC